MGKLTITCILLLFFQAAGVSQTASPPAATGASTGMPRAINAVFDYLTMAGTETAADFKPLTQSEQNRNYLKSMINPVLYFKAAISAGIDQGNNKPMEWGQGGSAYGKRFANITGQYAIQRTATFGLSSLLGEDNRYFGSGKKGFWSRTGYAISSSFLARHKNGKRYPSVSMLGGFASASFVSRAWQPPSTQSAGDGAVSFGYCIGYNVLGSVVKEFLPDVLRPFSKNRKPGTP